MSQQTTFKLYSLLKKKISGFAKMQSSDCDHSCREQGLTKQ